MREMLTTDTKLQPEPGSDQQLFHSVYSNKLRISSAKGLQ